LLLSAACTGDTGAGSADTVPHSAIVGSGDSARGPAWLVDRAAQERTLALQTALVRDFRFTDRREASGITFASRIVDDAGREYKAVHYDHGMGLAVADVNGDSLPDLYFVSQLGTSELWKNAGGGRFTAATQDAGLAMPDAVAVGASFADIDNDGDADLFVTTVRHGNRLFENDGAGRFRDITARAGVGFSGHSSGAVFFDYDRDGLLDLFVANVGVYTSNETGPGGYYVGLVDAFRGHTHAERADASILYRNAGGNRFEDVTKKVGLVDTGWSGDAVAMDANEDGFPDLYALNMQGENHLWLNEGGKRFRDVTKEYFPRTPWGAMGAKVFDFDGDSRLDLYVTDMHSDMFSNIQPGDWAGESRKSDPAQLPADLFPTGKSQFIFGNALFANRGGEQHDVFEEVSDRFGVETYWPWGPSVDDLNADSWDDIVVIGSMNFPFRYSVNSVLLNDGGRRFVRSEFTLGVEPRAGGKTDQEWFRLECGGADRGSRACAVCAGPNAVTLGCRLGPDGRGPVMGSRGGRSAALVDIDRDGDLDIVMNEFNAAPQLLVSDLAERRRVNAVTVRLRGTKSNRQGLGARVTVELPNQRRVLKVMDGKSGYLSQSVLPLYFGLGEFTEATAVEVMWPSGQRQRVSGPFAAGRTIEVVEQ